MSRLKKLYHDQIMEFSRNPFHFYEMRAATFIFTAYNPMCGDKFTFYLSIENGLVKDASFTGYGCAISKASSSVLVSKLINTDCRSIPVILNDFFFAINFTTDGEISKINSDYIPFLPVKEFPERMQCVLLGWKELEKQIREGNLSN